jgi:2-keto-4-pentenoate hydratase/2-oxohepta-3-ene-1,7-dioic acid hydratase in catechol pathway
MSRARILRVARYRFRDAPHVGFLDGRHFVRLDGPPWEGGRETGARDPVAEAVLLPPCSPTKIVCAGLNYRDHVAESSSMAAARPTDEPVIFLKPPTAVIASGEAIRYPAGVERVDPEAEMAVVIGRRARRLALGDVPMVVAGLTCLNDVTARDLQRRDVQWTRAKGFDTFAPLGPWVAVGLSPRGLQVTCRVNGAVRQAGNTADQLVPVPELVRFVSHVMTLEPGDVIATGTPGGVAPVRPGDLVEVEVEGVGVLENRVVWGDDE